MVITAADVSVAVNGDIRWEDSGDVGIVIAFNEDTDTYTNETTDAQEATANDILLPPFQTTILGDYTAFGNTEKFSWINVDYSTAASITGGTAVWQYWDGSTWSTLTVVDDTSFFVTAATTAKVTFTPPDDWVVTIIDSVEGFFIRLYYSAAPSVITTAPLGDQVWQNVGAGDGPYTVLELHRYLGTLADDQQASSDDFLDITSSTPSERSTDNIITLNGSYNISDDFAQRLYDGSITQATGDDVYSGLVVVGSLYGTTTLQVVQVNELYNGDSPFWGTGQEAVPASNILSQMLIKTRYGGTDRDGKRIRVFAREWGETFAEFSLTMGLGNATAAIFTVEDLNNDTGESTVETWSGITNTEGYQGIDLDNGDGTLYYYSKWDYSTYDVKQVYQRTKWLSRRGTGETLHGLDGELFRGITHEVPWTGQTATDFYIEDEIVSWGTGATAGTGVILADSEAGVDGGTTGTSWIQLLTGAAPISTQTLTGATSGVTATIGTVVARSLTPQFFGTSTGTTIIGSYGIGVDPTDAGQNDILFDLTGTARYPPNLVDFYVYLLISGDYVLVTPEDGSGGLDYDQLTLNTTLNSTGQTSIVCTGAIPADTPQIGTVRVQLDSGIYRRVAYTSWVTATFTTASTDWTDPLDATQPKNIFISYIDLATSGTEETFQTKYDAPRTLFIRVRDGGGTPIKTYETTAALGSAGGSASASRIADT